MAVRKFFGFAAVMLFCAAAAFAQDVTGDWTAEFESQIGVQKYKYEFKVKGEKLTGKAYAEVDGKKRDSELTEGKVKGADISFVEMLKFDDMEIKIEYSGKIKGDEINLTRKVGDFASYEITLKRVKTDAKMPPKK